MYLLRGHRMVHPGLASAHAEIFHEDHTRPLCTGASSEPHFRERKAVDVLDNFVESTFDVVQFAGVGAFVELFDAVSDLRF